MIQKVKSADTDALAQGSPSYPAPRYPLNGPKITPAPAVP